MDVRMKILHILPSRDPSAATRELHLLLANAGPSADVWTLDGWRRWLDPRPLWALAQRVRDFQPDLIHAWGLSALRAARLVSRQAVVVVSHPLRTNRVTRLDRWLLPSAAAIVVSGAAEAERCRAAGLPAAKLRLVPPGVALPPMVPTPHAAPVIACVGALRPDKGFHDAIWAFDILHFTVPDLELVLVGDGPERRRLEAFAQRIGLSHRVHFQSRQADAAAALARAWVVWIPSHQDTGVSAALEAMAAGRPVIAARWPRLAEIVTDGQTGLLAIPGDKMALARQTQRLLMDNELRLQLAASGRRHVELHCRPEHFAQGWYNHCCQLIA
jgi:glycosyltransferase involved in cell wall biosynthesis